MNIEKEYHEIENDYTDFFKEIKRTIEKLLIEKNIPIAFNIYGRKKQLSSIQEKLSSGRFTVKKTITEINDLVGLRIVLLFPEYKKDIIDLLSSEFELLNSKVLKDEQSPDKFGYNSTHLILKIKEEWLTVPDWRNHSEKKIEVQIRTLSEHIWAEISHTLFYKREENIPNIINRDLYRVSALLEVVDEKLQNIKSQVEKHYNYIKECDYEEILKLDLFPETFRRVMLKNSEGIYNLDNDLNKELSSKIEKDYNILTTNALDDLITDKINLENIDNDNYVDKVLKILEADKERINNKQQEKAS
ncbi:hypothetical protein DVK85_13020 [Flavobacterium arcticum]|uniref:RelA/SpoT domain-containing protein n=1 Tax=Flavobacterium arcticum TaxID=1784713 RepID=A0A345HEU1_9FLAO|nr:hypothetical protein [Flavobacterium arcticum]AXG75101.1 hypothetical protein DVK85_13020 [Flavobacterium arcticum]KAF2511120.1 hypothetical protein E0W72_06925 [Flavobacterium arcticum]